MFDLTGRVMLVTGAASGIGAAVCRRAAAAGADVVRLDIAPMVVGGDGAGADDLVLRADVAREDEVRAAVDRIREERGRIDVVVNNAGVAVSDRSTLEDSDAAYLRAFRVNALGAVHVIRSAVPLMRDGGAIVNIASLSAVIGAPLLGAYAASKAALVEITRTTALELAERRIRVNAVAPSGVLTPMYEGDDDALVRERAWIGSAGALPRAATADEIAAVVHFLASDDCALITGQTIVVDGGLSVGPALPLLDRLVGESSDAASDGER